MLNLSFIKKLKNLGVKEVVSCPGGRSASLLNQFVNSKDFKVESFYDERSAGFYALGRSIITNTPVVVLTTSGSAVASVYPAMLEAQHQENGKLILISADRPSEFSGTGAPQTIVQNDFFKTNGIKTTIVNDFDESFDFSNSSYPMHINLHSKDPNPLKIGGKESVYESLLIISSLKKGEEKKLKESLLDYEGALILESLSNLKESDFPNATVLKYADKILSSIGIFSFKKIYRLGGVPLLKCWRQIHLHKSVFYWNEYSHQGTIGATALSLEEIVEDVKSVKNNLKLKDKVLKVSNSVEEVIKNNADSEVSKIKELALIIPKGSKVFIGNSMPVREWEFVDTKNFYNIGQRGVNGIDGSLALFLGQLEREKENWIILGDLTTLYNLNDFQILKQLKNYKIRIVIVNNAGGRIFEKIFKENKEYFINEQEVSFKDVSKLWKVQHTRSLSEVKEHNHVLLEYCVDPKASVKFWQEMEKV